MTINLIINNEKIALNDIAFPAFEEGETVFIYDGEAKCQYKVHSIVKTFQRVGNQVDGGLEVYLA